MYNNLINPKRIQYKQLFLSFLHDPRVPGWLLQVVCIYRRKTQRSAGILLNKVMEGALALLSRIRKCNSSNSQGMSKAWTYSFVWSVTVVRQISEFLSQSTQNLWKLQSETPTQAIGFQKIFLQKYVTKWGFSTHLIVQPGWLSLRLIFATQFFFCFVCLFPKKARKKYTNIAKYILKCLLPSFSHS